MSSRRGYRRRDYIPRNYISKASKYQFVPFSIQFNYSTLDPLTPGIINVLVPTSTVAGIRKVKNFNINFVSNTTDPLLFAVLYIPEGADTANLTPNINGFNVDGSKVFAELFAANQWVIGCGSIVAGALNNWKTRMSRNLNNGDSVYMFIWQLQPNDRVVSTVKVNATGNYAIRYN